MSSRLGFAAYYSRNIIKWFAIGVVVYLVLYIAWILTEPLRFREPPPPPIEIKFEIPQTISFPEPDPGVEFTYRLETVTGQLPLELSDRGVVFLNEKPMPNFFNFDNAVKVAKNLKFDSEPIPYNPPVYQWRNIFGLPGLLEINVTTGEADMVNNWQTDRNILLSTRQFTQDNAFKDMQKVFAKADLWNEDLQKGDHSFIFYKAVGGQLMKVSAISQADLVQVNFRRAAVNGLPVVHADPERPPVWGLVTRGGDVLELHFHYWKLGPRTSEYPLRPIASAWTDLLEGKAHIARIGENVPGSEVVVRDFSLAYYISNDYQPFTEPVYVIRGDGDFMAMTQAIDRSIDN